MNAWLMLFGAILCEVVGTSCLKAADGFTKLWPSVAVVVGYAGAFYLMSLTIRTIPLGITYSLRHLK